MKRSRPSMTMRTPSAVTPRTSAFPMNFFPRLEDGILVLPDELKRHAQPSATQALILRQLDEGLHPELCLAGRAPDMNVPARFLGGIEIDSQPLRSQHRR